MLPGPALTALSVPALCAKLGYLLPELLTPVLSAPTRVHAIASPEPANARMVILVMLVSAPCALTTAPAEESVPHKSTSLKRLAPHTVPHGTQARNRDAFATSVTEALTAPSASAHPALTLWEAQALNMDVTALDVDCATTRLVCVSVSLASSEPSVSSAPSFIRYYI